MIMVRSLAIALFVLLAGASGAAAKDPQPLLAQADTQDATEPDANDELPPEAEPEPEPEPPPPPRRAVPPPRLQAPPAALRNAPQPGPITLPQAVQRPPTAPQPTAKAAPSAPNAEGRPRPAIIRPAMTAPASSGGVPPLDELTATRERPLFSSTRRPPAPPEEPEVNAPITEAKSLSFELVGVVRSSDSAFAILRNTESKEETRVPKGEKFGAWTIEEIEDRSIIMAGEAKRVRVRLFDESKAPGIRIQRVGAAEDAGDVPASDAEQVDEEIAPNTSPEGRPATAQPVQRRVKGEMSPAQRRRARLQQQQQMQQRQRPPRNDE